MVTEDLIAAEECSMHYEVEISFIESLKDAGLIETRIVEQRLFIPISSLDKLERLARLYYEMEINLEGIETIQYLLERMNEMQRKIRELEQGR